MSYDNRIDIHVFDRDYTLEASLGAASIYANEFKGKLSEPYLGNLPEDVFRLFRSVEMGADSYSGIDYEVLFACMWAMAKAADSMPDSWRQFHDSIAHKPLTLEEVTGVYSVIVHELGDGVFFRLSTRLGDDSQSDEEQAEE